MSTMIDAAIAAVERDMSRAHKEVLLARDAYTVASARWMALVGELCDLCQANKPATTERKP